MSDSTSNGETPAVHIEGANNVVFTGDNNTVNVHFAEVINNPIGRMGLVLLKDYINRGFDDKNIKDVPKLDGLEEESKLSAEELETCKSIGHQLARIGDAFQQDETLQRSVLCPGA